MGDREDEKLTEEAKQLLRKTRVPHKFCPHCGMRNQADAQDCAGCGKDISWMRIPEPIPHSEPPREKPRSLPEQQKVFTLKVVLVIALIVGLLLAFVLVILLVTRGKSAELMSIPGMLAILGLCALRHIGVRPFALNLRTKGKLS